MAQMNTEGVRQRVPPGKPVANGTAKAPASTAKDSEHPAGPVQYGILMQLLRVVAFSIYFFSSCMFIHMSQVLGSPLYLWNKDHFYAWQALCKQFFGLLTMTGTQWWSPTLVRVSGDKSVKGQLRQTKDGLLEVDFGERIVLIANHQIYTDWVYMWWIAYCNSTPTHGHLFIILKESLKYVPLLGPAMMFYRFIFMARKWAKDQERLRYRLQKLNTATSGPLARAAGQAGKGGHGQLDPMWLLIFPEGTNLSANTRKGSAKWADKQNIADVKYMLLPRSTGLQFCLQELRNSVEYVYDCTIAYSPIPHGQYGQDIFTLRSVYLQGRAPKSVNMHWRRFAVKDMPIDDHEAMEKWVLDRWREKDEMMEYFQQHDRFQGDAEALQFEGYRGFVEGKKAFKDCIDTEVRPRHRRESLQMFMPVAAATLVGRILVQITDLLFGNWKA